MKRILATVALALLTVPTAFAADTRLELPLRELINSPQARAAGIDGSVRFYLAGEKTPAVAARMGEDVTNKKTNGVGKDDATACKWAALSALIAFQDSAKQKGANAVIDLHSFNKRNVVKNPTHIECRAGAVVVGTTLQGTYAKTGK